MPIITVTFSPCIDKSMAVDSLVPETKLRCTAPKLEPGGGGINVARAIQKLGGRAIAVYPAGGYTGKFFTALLHQEQVSTSIIETSQETRENIIVLEESTQRQFRFGMPGSVLDYKEWNEILTRLEAIKDASYIIASGSLPPGVPKDVFARIADIARNKKAKFIADTSGSALQQVLEAGVFLIKPNLGELSQLVGASFLELGDIAPAAKQVIDTYSCHAVVVSMGAAGALLVTAAGVTRIVPPVVERKSTVGAGDSMVGGIVFKLSIGERLEAAVQYGVACGTAATLNNGSELCKKEDADKIAGLLTVEATAFANNSTQ